MQTEKYTVTQYPISAVLGFIDAGDIAIPEIQRPFVWKRSQVRDLIDSLYHGYPTGYLIIWQNPNVRLKTGESSSGKKILIDGQQRVTALMAAISGREIIDDDYQSVRIKIAFNPIAKEDEEHFAVQTPAQINDKKWVPDISELFKPNFRAGKFRKEYLADNPEMDEDELDDALTMLKAIAGRQLGVIELAHSLQIDEVTEIFIRINSQGKALGQADFVMSKISADEKYGGNILRKAIDYFCHLAVKPEFYSVLSQRDHEFMESEYAAKLKWLKDDKEDTFDPDYGDMLRVSFMHKFGRGKISDLVSLLSGRDFETREYKESVSEYSFTLLKSGVLNFMNEFNFTNFVLSIKSAGFVSDRLINSQMTLDFAYTLYLLLSADSSIPKTQLKRYVQKWYLLSVLTGRYISSPESAMDKDIRSIATKGFVPFLEESEAAVLSDTFWDIGLVQSLETSAINSPYFNAYTAAQNFFGENSLFMHGTKVRDLIITMGDVHHIFPKKYLQSKGIKDRTKYNQVANYVYLDTQLNISIGAKAPNEYFKLAFEQCETKSIIYGNITELECLLQNMETNCIPNSIVDMDSSNYEEFLMQRRHLMAKKIKGFYKAL
jgi:uncharacterized protein with ParB-like and HNH nuclease domain